ncbi:MAG: IclR family transcriptional regulator [Eubacterium sp.]|nr:IclR family transcriptional regulator [Eubacterium sp.]
MAAENTVQKHQSLSSIRLLKIMECLSTKRTPMRLTDLARELKMTQPTVLRYLNALYSEGYAYQDPATGNYGLTWKVRGIADQVKANSSLQALVHPYLAEMSNRLNVGMLLATERNGDIVYLDLVISPDSMETFLRIGKDAPLHATSSGKIMLSTKSDAQVKDILDRKGMPELTAHTITNHKQMADVLDEVRTNGFALDDEECEIGHRCVSVPLHDYTGTAIAAISASDTTENLTRERVELILPELRKTASAIEYILGYSK